MDAALGAVSAADVCVRLYKDLSKRFKALREMGHDISDIESRIKETEARLYAFARIHNVAVSTDRSSRTKLPPLWSNSVISRMGQIRSHLEEAQAILDKYATTKIDSSSVGDTAPQKAKGETTNREQGIVEFGLKMRATDSLAVMQAQKKHVERSSELHKSSPGKKLAWALRHREKLTNAIEHLEADNDSLRELTAPHFETLIYDAIASRLTIEDFRHVSARHGHAPSTTTNSEKHLAKVRIQREFDAKEFVHRLETEQSAIKDQRVVPEGLLKDLLSLAVPESPKRVKAVFTSGAEEFPVLVEWKTYNSDLISKREALDRVADIVAILGFLNSDPALLQTVLPSHGYFHRNGTDTISWIGIVYDLSSLPLPLEERSLRDLLKGTKSALAEDEMRPTHSDDRWAPTFSSRRSRNSNRVHQSSGENAVWKPPLGDRFRLALSLAETLLSIHNCDWFHKGLRPENVVFLSSKKSILNPYLLGWDYSRSGKAGQKTELVESWNSEAELYQHPNWFSDPPAQDGSKYSAEYDQYQFGCVLLEIGLWKLLGDLEKNSGEKFDGSNKRKSWQRHLILKAEELKVEMGNIYFGVVIDLLKGLNSNDQEKEFWDSVVLQLTRCTV